MRLLDAIRSWFLTNDLEERPFTSDNWSAATEVLEYRLVLGSLSTGSSISDASQSNAVPIVSPTGSGNSQQPVPTNYTQTSTSPSQLSNLQSTPSNTAAQTQLAATGTLTDATPKPVATLNPTVIGNTASTPTTTPSTALPAITTPINSSTQQATTAANSPTTTINVLATQSSLLPPSDPIVPPSPPAAIDTALTAVNSKVLVNSSVVAAAKSGVSAAVTGIPEVPAWLASQTATAVINYDFRNANGVKNEITQQQIQAAQQVLQDWSAASNGRIQFVQDTTSPTSSILNIGVGNLSAVGKTSAEGGTLGTSIHALTTVGGNQTSVGTIWLDDAESWSTPSTGSTSSGAGVDFATVMAHEVGHVLGIADDSSTQGIMNPDYTGPQDLSGIATAFQNPIYFSTSSEDANGFISDDIGASNPQLTTNDVIQLMDRAAAAAPVNNAIIAVVDRNGNILGVLQEAGVLSTITSPATLAFATDGAVSLARTAALFSNDTAPLTSRTIEDLSQTTMLQREVQSNPNSTDPAVNGPGFVAPIGIGGNFPAGIANTPPVDLFNIEASNRGSTPPATASTVAFNIQTSQVPVTLPTSPPAPVGSADFLNPGGLTPSQVLPTLISYGTAAGIAGDAQNRGIATLPGGVPIYLNGVDVGGIGVFFPGKDGYATTEQGFVQGTVKSVTHEMNTTQELEAEYMAFAAVGGSPGAASFGVSNSTIGTLGGYAPVAGVSLPFGFITLNGISLPLFGSTPGTKGLQDLIDEFASVSGTGTTAGATIKVLGNSNPTNNLVDPGTLTGAQLAAQIGIEQSSGWLAEPPATVPITSSTELSQSDITEIIDAGIAAANKVRAQIRLGTSDTGATGAAMTFAITDTQGNVLALYRMSDGTVFSTDVAIAKARNVAYYDNPASALGSDQVATTPNPAGPLVPLGTDFTARTFRFLAEPYYPDGANGSAPGPFSILNNVAAAGINPATGQNIGAPAPASAFTSVMGHDVFNPNTNFNATPSPTTQNGIVFFPGSTPLYKDGKLVGGLGVSGDGVSQDDVVTYLAAQGFEAPPAGVLTADQVVVGGVRLPFQKFDRNPFGS